MADGTITFSTALDNKELESQLNSLTKKINSLEDKIAQKQSERLPMTAQAEQLGVELDSAKAKLFEMQNAAAGAFSSEDVKEQRTHVNGLQSEWNRVQGKVEKYDTDIQKAAIELDRNKEKAGTVAQQLSKAKTNSTKMGEAVDKAGKNLDTFKKRLASVVRSALVFVVITQALAKLRDWVGAVIKVNPQATAAIAKLKGALLTLAQPLVNVIIPAFIWLVNVLTKILTVIARFTSMLAGTTVAASAAAAEALNKQTSALNKTGKAAKKASRSLAAFDEINKLDDNSDSNSDASASIAPDFSALKGLDTQKYKDKIDELTVYISGALLALGVILTFSGANIPLGLGLMALGALGLAAEIKENWGAMPDKVKEALTNVAGAVGGVLLGIGAVLCFSGANIPLGIALMAAGAVSLAAAMGLNWDSTPDKVKLVLKVLELAVGGAEIALGAMLCLSGASIPLGLAFLAAGAASILAAAALDWDSMPDKTKSVIAIVAGAIGGALLALGALLAFSGVGIPLGIALMAAGAVTLATAGVLNWDSTPNKVASVIKTIVTAISGALIVIGILLCFTGAGVPLGIGLILAGAAGMVAAATVNWDSLVTALQGPIGKTVAFVSSALLVLGIILVCTGVGIPLGIGLILAGAAGLATAVAVNWDAILDKIKDVWDKIKSWWSSTVAPVFTVAFWKNIFSCIGEAFNSVWTAIKHGAEMAWYGIKVGVISLVNFVIDAINTMIKGALAPINLLIGAINKIPGVNIPKLSLSIPDIALPPVPALAAGAVIPPNQQFLAMLGDQKSGTNIEAPESLIRRIVREESANGGGDTVVNNVLKLDGRTVYKNQQRIKRLTGKSLVEEGAYS